MKQCLLGTTLASILAGAALSLSPSFAQTPPTHPAVSKARLEYYRGDVGHTGYLDTVFPKPVSLAWRYTSTSTTDNPASPVYANGVVFYAGSNHVTAINAVDGSLKWTFTAHHAKSGNFSTTPAISGNALYIGEDEGYFYKIDLETGKQIWESQFGGPIRSSAVFDGGLVYFGCDDGSIYALSTDTGQTTWSRSTGGAVSTSPTIVDGLLVFASADSSVYGVDDSSGRVRWATPFTGDPTLSPPVASQGELYVGAGSYIYSIILHSGSIRWRARLSADLNSPISVGPNGLYVVTQDNMVQGLTDHGRVEWKTDLRDLTQSAPLLTRNVFLVPTVHGVLNAFDVDTGALKWQYAVQTASADPKRRKAATPNVASFPIFVDNTLFVAGDDGTLSAMRSDAIDNIAPVISSLRPAPGTASASYDTSYRARLVDDGSGIDPASVQILVDGKRNPQAYYDPAQNAILTTPFDTSTGKVPHLLADGHHQVLVKAADWRGNLLMKTWGFTADSRLNPKDTPADLQIDPLPPPAPDASSTPNTANGGNATPPAATPPNGGGGGNNTAPPPPPPL